jgi:hypothetical protein
VTDDADETAARGLLLYNKDRAGRGRREKEKEREKMQAGKKENSVKKSSDDKGRQQLKKFVDNVR